MSAPEIKPSATLILLRQSADNISGNGIETVLLKRHEAMAFGNAWVFPGGKIDPQDYEKSYQQDCRKVYDCIPDDFFKDKQIDGLNEISAAVHAAVRETHEEANVIIDPDHLALISCWTTPSLGDKPRFRTWFFIAEIQDQKIIVDGKEMLDHKWLTLDQAIQTEMVQQLGMLPPTYNTLLEINQYSSVKEAISALQPKPPRVYNPKLVSIDGGFVSLYEGDAGYETEDLSVEGPRHRLIGDKDGYHLDKTID